MKTYEQALTHFIPLQPKDWTPIQYSLFNAALECDRLVRRCSDNAKMMSERFTTYANDLAEGRLWEPPTGSSVIYDLTADHARLRMAAEHLYSLIVHNLGPSIRKEYDRIRSEMVEPRTDVHTSK